MDALRPAPGSTSSSTLEASGGAPVSAWPGNKDGVKVHAARKPLLSLDSAEKARISSARRDTFEIHNANDVWKCAQRCRAGGPLTLETLLPTTTVLPGSRQRSD